MPKMGSLKDRLQDALEKLSYRQWIMIAAGASILLGLAVFFALPSANEKSAREQAMREARVKGVGAEQDIPQRTMVKESMLQVVEVPPDGLPAGAITATSSRTRKPSSTRAWPASRASSRRTAAPCPAPARMSRASQAS